MQSIERYGVVALLFLIVTVAAVLMWGDGRDKNKESRAAIAARTEGASSAPGNTVVRANTAAQRNAPLTDERARLREELRAKAEVPVSDRIGVPSNPSRGAEGNMGSRPGESESGIVPGGDSYRPDRFAESSRGEYDSNEDNSAPELASLESDDTQAESGRAETRTEEPTADSRKRNRGQKSRQGVPVYVVRKNEVLGKIAQRELGTVKRMQEIIDLNPGLNPNRIVEGLKLRMPTNWSAGASPAVASAADVPRGTAAAAPAGLRPYVVKDGESLWRIAESQLGRGKLFKEIEAANPSIKDGSIKAGQTIYLPSRSDSPAVANVGPTVASRTAESDNAVATRGRVR